MKYKGDLEGFPDEVVEKMLYYQVKQDNKKDVRVFESKKTASGNENGFKWALTPEGYDFWIKVIYNEDFELFFNKYPKKNTTDDIEFEVGDWLYLLDNKAMVADVGALAKFEGTEDSYIKVRWQRNHNGQSNGCYYAEIFRKATEAEINSIEPKVEFKVGDYVIIKDWTDNYNGRLVQITKFSNLCSDCAYFKVFDGGYYNKHHNFITGEYCRLATEEEISKIKTDQPFKAGDKLVGKDIYGADITSEYNPLGVINKYFIADKIEYNIGDHEIRLWSDRSYWGCNIKDISLYTEKELENVYEELFENVYEEQLKPINDITTTIKESNELLDLLKVDYI